MWAQEDLKDGSDTGHADRPNPRPARMLVGGSDFGAIALDHRQNLRRDLRPDNLASVTFDKLVDFKRAVVRGLGTVATGVLLDPGLGAPQCIVDGSLPAVCGLLVAIEATGYGGPSAARVSGVLDDWSVAKAKRMGASAAKLLVYYDPDARTPRTRTGSWNVSLPSAWRQTCHSSSSRSRSRSTRSSRG